MLKILFTPFLAMAAPFWPIQSALAQATDPCPALLYEEGLEPVADTTGFVLQQTDSGMQYCEGLYDTLFSESEPEFVVHRFAGRGLRARLDGSSELQITWESPPHSTNIFILFDFPKTSFRLQILPEKETEFIWNLDQIANDYDLDFDAASILGAYLHDGKRRYFPVYSELVDKDTLELVVSYPHDVESLVARAGEQVIHNGQERCKVLPTSNAKTIPQIPANTPILIEDAYFSPEKNCLLLKISTNARSGDEPVYKYKQVNY